VVVAVVAGAKTVVKAIAKAVAEAAMADSAWSP
jgi:hypothetical protein